MKVTNMPITLLLALLGLFAMFGIATSADEAFAIDRMIEDLTVRGIDESIINDVNQILGRNVISNGQAGVAKHETGTETVTVTVLNSDCVIPAGPPVTTPVVPPTTVTSLEISTSSTMSVETMSGSPPPGEAPPANPPVSVPTESAPPSTETPTTSTTVTTSSTSTRTSTTTRTSSATETSSTAEPPLETPPPINGAGANKLNAVVVGLAAIAAFH